MGENRENKELLPPTKRPSSGCMEMENSTKRPRIHQQNENQQVCSTINEGLVLKKILTCLNRIHISPTSLTTSFLSVLDCPVPFVPG